MNEKKKKKIGVDAVKLISIKHIFCYCAIYTNLFNKILFLIKTYTHIEPKQRNQMDKWEKKIEVKKNFFYTRFIFYIQKKIRS